jgi:transcriptional regulator of arginine metabolism
MANLKERRQRAVAELIRKQAPASQEELAGQLAELGFAVTQATVSRDLEQLGAVRVRRAGQTAYALPQEVGGQTEAAPRLSRILADWCRSIACAHNLVVIKAPPGSAQLIGSALDQAELEEVVGTVCGDDTIFIACRGPSEARTFADRLEAWRNGPVH